MSLKRNLLLCGILVLMLAMPLTSVAAQQQSLKLAPYDGGVFTINIPSGWQVHTAGICASFSFVIRDPSNPLRQIMLFGRPGPVYLSEQYRQMDRQYSGMGGYNAITWSDMPVVAPLTPGNFMIKFNEIAKSQLARQIMPQAPRLESFQVVSETPLPTFLSGGQTALVRGLFMKEGKLGEGLFHVTVAPLSQVAQMYNLPGGGLAYGRLVAGITAPKAEFASMQEVLRKSLESFTLSPSYISNCMRQQAQGWAAANKAGQTLRETSDILRKGWEERSKTYDIIAEKRSDVMLGKERVYNPTTGEVYEFENGFYDKYDLHRQQYEMSNLQLLPDSNYELWMRATKDGYRHLR